MTGYVWPPSFSSCHCLKMTTGSSQPLSQELELGSVPGFTTLPKGFWLSISEISHAKVYWHSARGWWRLMKENFMDTCGCVNSCTCAWFQLSSICRDNIRHGIGGGKPRMGGGKPRKRLGRVTAASRDLQIFSQRFRVINTARRVAFVLLFHFLSMSETRVPHSF